MKLVMCIRTRDQAELVDAQVSFHLNAGVDFVIVTDHRSQDGTLEILEAYEREGSLHLIRETGETVRGSEWRTRMARLAALEHDADWVIQADGDEFWWPRGNALKEVLEPVPEGYGVVHGLLRFFVPRLDADGFFAERMTVRLTPQAPLNDRLVPYRPNTKVAHRGDPRVVVDRGAHSLLEGGLPLRGWYPIEVFHFPVRSLEQLEQKTLAWWGQMKHVGRVGNVRAHGFHQEDRMDEYYASLAVGEEELERGLADGSLVVDTRLRDVLRSLRLDQASGARQFSIPTERPEPLVLPLPGVVDEAAYAVDVATLGEADVVRLQSRLDEIELRLTRQRRGLWRKD